MKYKVGDKVKIVKPEGVGIGFNGRTGIVSGIQRGRYLVNGIPLTWGEDELKLVEENQVREYIFDKLAHSIAEAAKEANILVEPTEDGGIKISPMEVKEEDLPIDTPVMCGNSDNEIWSLRYYAFKGKVYSKGFMSPNNEGVTSFEYIIPFDKFNPNDIEESLKCNIVK